MCCEQKRGLGMCGSLCSAKKNGWGVGSSIESPYVRRGSILATHKTQNDRAGARFAIYETPVEIPNECTRVTFLAQTSHHLLSNLPLHVFPRVVMDPIWL